MYQVPNESYFFIEVANSLNEELLKDLKIIQHFYLKERDKITL